MTKYYRSGRAPLRWKVSAPASMGTGTYLCAGHREHTVGAPPDWAIELVPAPYPADGNQTSTTIPEPVG
jgi:hypothetical protein